MSESKQPTTPVVDPATATAIQAMIEAGVFFGRTKNHANPRMRNHVLHSRNGMEIFNLHSTLESSAKAMAFLKEVIANGGTALFIGTQPAFSDLVENLVEDTKTAAVTKRWLGGTLTNFGQMMSRINHMKKLRSDMQAGLLDKYTKKERVDFDRELTKLQSFLGPIENMTRMPDVMIVIDPKEHAIAVHEALRSKVPVIAFANVDANPDNIQFVVPGNNRGRKSVSWFLEQVREALKTPRRVVVAEAAPAPEAAAPAPSSK